MALSKKMKQKFDDISAMISDTPMIEISLKYKGEERKVYAKAEYYSYTGSIKDRIAFHIMKDAYIKGLIQEGDTVAEATSGNTGISFAAIGSYLGNPVIIYMPDWMSQERVDLIRSFGAEIRFVTREDGGFSGAISLAEEMGKREGAFLPRQFSNLQNVDAHYRTTGKEIIRQLPRFAKNPDGIVAGIGTGGTLMGVKKALQEIYPGCRAFPLDPANASPLASGGRAGGNHRIAGIGDEFIPEIVKLNELDDIILIHDGDAINMARKLAADLGLGVGISSGANLLGSIRAQDILGCRDAVIVTVFADDNKKYLSTDLMKDQPEEYGDLTPHVELTGFRAIR